MEFERIKEVLQKNHDQLMKDLSQLYNIEQMSEAITVIAALNEDDEISKPLEDKMIQNNKQFRTEIFADFNAEETYNRLIELADEGVITLNDNYMESLKERFS